jgi:hypothetical protein
MDHRGLNTAELTKLRTALRGNAKSGFGLLMDRRDTSFLGTCDASEEADEAVIDLVAAVPCHY